jgi:hypothetical protein
MELLGDVAHVESCFGPFSDGVSVKAKQLHGLSQTYHRVRNPFGCTRWYSKVMWLMWNLVSVRSVIVLVSEQDRCTVCAKHRVKNSSGRTQRFSKVTRLKWKLVLVRLEIGLILTQESTICTERTIGSENCFGRTRWNS